MQDPEHDFLRPLEAPEGPEVAGLVSYATFPTFDLAELAGFKFPGAELVDAAASMFPKAPGAFAGHRWRKRLDVEWVQGHVWDIQDGGLSEYRDAREGQWPQLVIGPGMVRFQRRDTVRAEATAERLREERENEVDRARAAAQRWHSWPMALLPDFDLSPVIVRSRVVEEFSRKSRARLREKIARLDLSGFVTGEQLPAMLTLTLPDNWLAVAPDAATIARKFDRFVQTYKQKWGALSCIWKREFQRRGAPHYHLWLVPPAAPGGMPEFRRWVSQTWTRLLFADLDTATPGHARECRCGDYCKSLAAGTGVDFASALRARDPNRLAEYFLKEAGFSEAKAYQNRAPVEWEGQPVGRFWGVRNIPEAVAIVDLRPEHDYQIWRRVRAVRRARSGFSIRRSVERVDYTTGQIRRRWVSRRPIVRSAAGWVAVNDGAAFGAALGIYATALRLGELPCNQKPPGSAHICERSIRGVCIGERVSFAS